MIPVKDTTTHIQTETIKVGIDVYGPLKERIRREKEMAKNMND